MSVTAMGRTFWTEFPHLSYTDKKGKQITIKATTAKIVLLAIADNSDDFGENSYQSFETLATKSSLDRRSVMRVVRALVSAGFLTVAGISVYGTNNYSICLNKLGQAPAKRAKTGRPKSGDSEALGLKGGDPEAGSGDSDVKSGDSVTESGDPKSPDPSFIPPVSTLKRGDLVDGYLDLAQSPGIKRAARLDAILSYLGGKLRINTETKRWKDFAKFVDDRQQAHHEPLDIFVSWLTSQKDFNIQFWSPARMQEMYPQAFLLENQPNTPQINAAAVEQTKQYNENRWNFTPAPPPANLVKPALKKPERRVRS
jgi:hypothetical protein